MEAEQCIRDGDLAGAIEALTGAVRKQPAKAELRTFLFQLLAVMGQWDRALTQLNVTGDLDALTLPMVQTYREALACEALRHEVYAGNRRPLLFGEPEQWIALLFEALDLDAKNAFAEAQAVRDKAFEQAPATSGAIGDESFEWISDCDQRLGPILEVVMNGNFYWVPFHRIQRIQFDPPEDLRDFVWLPGEFTWANGGESVGLVPSRYPNTQDSEDPGLMLGRKTEWLQPAPGIYQGRGQRMFATNVNEYSLLDVREITLNTAATTDPDSNG